MTHYGLNYWSMYQYEPFLVGKQTGFIISLPSENVPWPCSGILRSLEVALPISMPSTCLHCAVSPCYKSIVILFQIFYLGDIWYIDAIQI